MVSVHPKGVKHSRNSSSLGRTSSIIPRGCSTPALTWHCRSCFPFCSFSLKFYFGFEVELTTKLHCSPDPVFPYSHTSQKR